MLSICGKTYEYIYIAEDAAELREKPIDPQNAFIVYDQSIEHTPLFGVYYSQKTNDLDESAKQPDTYFIVMTETELKYYKVPAGSGEVEVLPYDTVQHQLECNTSLARYH